MPERSRTLHLGQEGDLGPVLDQEVRRLPGEIAELAQQGQGDGPQQLNGLDPRGEPDRAQAQRIEASGGCHNQPLGFEHGESTLNPVHVEARLPGHRRRGLACDLPIERLEDLESRRDRRGLGADLASTIADGPRTPVAVVAHEAPVAHRV